MASHAEGQTQQPAGDTYQYESHTLLSQWST